MEFEEGFFFTWKEKWLLKLHIYSPRRNSPCRRVNMFLRKSIDGFRFDTLGWIPSLATDGPRNEVQQHFARLGPATLGQSAFG